MDTNDYLDIAYLYEESLKDKEQEQLDKEDLELEQQDYYNER